MWPIASAHDEAIGRDFVFPITYMLHALGERWGNLVTYVISLLSEIMDGCSICCHLCCCILTWPYILCCEMSGYFPLRYSHGSGWCHSRLWGCGYTFETVVYYLITHSIECVKGVCSTSSYTIKHNSTWWMMFVSSHDTCGVVLAFESGWTLKT